MLKSPIKVSFENEHSPNNRLLDESPTSRPCTDFPGSQEDTET